MKKRYLKIPPELNDGIHSGVSSVEDLLGNSSLCERIASWINPEESDSDVGDKLELEIIEMKEEEFKSLPDC